MASASRRLCALLAPPVALLGAALLLSASAGAADDPARAPDLGWYLPGLEFDPAVPAPAAFFGREVGTWHLRHDEIAAYLRLLAERSPWLRLEEYGRTVEGRPLLLLAAADERGHAWAEERARAFAAEEAAGRSSWGEADRPLVVWLACSVHGNEASGANAAPLLAYALAAARGGEIAEWRRAGVVLLDPCLNPDGHDRFATWVNAHRGAHPVADPAHREHHEPWPGGRGNHYGFDLNRDYLPLVQPESRARSVVYRRWRPHVYTDVHEMETGATFFFQPGVPGREHPLGSQDPSVGRLTAALARFHARALDEQGALYFTRERFDDFYIGKGSTYADLTGAVGVLHEQASARGVVQEGREGLVTLAGAVRRQLAAMLSTIRGAVAHGDDLRARSAAWAAGQMETAASPPDWIFGNARDPHRAAVLAGTLRRHGLVVRPLVGEARLGGRAYPAGAAWLVPARQVGAVFARAATERRTAFDDPVFYDISAWSLFDAYAVDAALTSAEAVEQVHGGRLGGPVTDPVAHVIAPAGAVAAREPLDAGAYAWAFAWSPRPAARALQRVLAAGGTARLAARATTLPAVGGRAYPLAAGAVLVARGQQPPDRLAAVRAALEAARTEDGLEVVSLASGYADGGGIDAGSGAFVPVTARAVAIVVGDGVSPASAGDLRYLLDVEVGLGPTLLEGSRVAGVDLGRYTTILLPDGTYGAVGEKGAEALGRWVRAGGTLIAVDRAVGWLEERKVVEAKLVVVEGDAASGGAEPDDDDDREDPPERLPYGAQEATEARRGVPGTIFAVEVDETHPLGFGLGLPTDETDGRPYLPVYKAGRTLLAMPGSPYAAPLVFRSGRTLLSGYVAPEVRDRLAGTPAVVALAEGRGHVVLFAFSPGFRGYWPATEKVLINAIFHAPGLRYPSREGWADE